MPAEIDWNRLLNIEYVAVFMGCMVGIIAVVGFLWFSHQKLRAEHELKRRLVDQGMSAEEIERIVFARRRDDEPNM